MSNCSYNPIAFDNKKNEILVSNYVIEWKKQISTVAIKKGIDILEFIEDKILSKIGGFNEYELQVICWFNYFTDDNSRRIYLISITKNTKAITDLYYTSHIPNKENVNLIVEKKSKLITQYNDYLRIKGDVIGICINEKNFYLENIDIGEYIDFVQDEENITEIDTDDYDEDKQTDNDTDASDDNEIDSNGEGTDNDGESDDNDDNDDIETGDDEEGESNDEGESENEAQDNDSQVEEDDGENDLENDSDMDIEVDSNDDKNSDESDEDDLDDLEDDIEADGDDAIDIDDIAEPVAEPTTSTKKKKGNTSKNIKLNTNIDLSIIFNILKPEPKDIITPEAELHQKRKTIIQILKQLNLSLPIKTIQLIEKGIYNYAIDKCNNKATIPLWENIEFAEIYISKSKNIYTNLNPNSYVKNVNLIENIKNGKIEPVELAFLDTFKLFPEMWKDIIEEKTKIEKMLKESLKESATDMFHCPRCHKRKTIYCEVQTRSSDEPMTKFITCLECGFKWKKY